MSLELQRLVDDYLRRLRRSMRGASTDVADEAELEIRAHIEDAVAGLDEPSAERMLEVLDRLGRPEDFGRDMVLYMMVDRGYRDWSLPHMLRSTVFWALTTLSGAVVVLIFGLLFALSAATAMIGLLRILLRGWADGREPPPLFGVDALAIGLAGIVLLTALVRWFVGQYVQRAGPSMAIGWDVGDELAWSRRAERKILLLAGSGLIAHLLAGLASGLYAGRDLSSPSALIASLPPDFTGSPMAAVSGLGLVLLALAPLLGVLWASREKGP